VTKTARTALWLFALALLVRLAAGLWTGFGREAVEDERGYVAIAESLAHGDGFGMQRGVFGIRDRGAAEFEEIEWIGPLDPVEPPPPRPLRRRLFPQFGHPRVSFRGPVIPLLLAPAAILGGGVAAMRLVSILLGALGAPLLFLALRNSPLGPRAWWPAAAYALWPPAIYVSVRALSEAPSQALFLGSLAVMAFTSTRAAVGSGALAALSVLARPAALLPAALLAFATGSRKRFLVFAVAFMAVLAPWQIRNWMLHGRPLMTTSTGVTLIGGNCFQSLDAVHPGKWVPPESVYANRFGPPNLGMWGWSEMSEEASDRRFAVDAVSWVCENPRAAAKLCFWKVVRLFDPDPHSEKDDAGAKAWIGWLTFAPVLLLAAIGARAWRQEWPWTLAVLGTVATALVFYGDTRMRTCADPALLVFAAHGAVSVARRLGARLVD
jgi:hypothetical protein